MAPQRHHYLELPPDFHLKTKTLKETGVLLALAKLLFPLFRSFVKMVKVG